MPAAVEATGGVSGGVSGSGTIELEASGEEALKRGETSRPCGSVGNREDAAGTERLGFGLDLSGGGPRRLNKLDAVSPCGKDEVLLVGEVGDSGGEVEEADFVGCVAGPACPEEVAMLPNDIPEKELNGILLCCNWSMGGRSSSRAENLPLLGELARELLLLAAECSCWRFVSSVLARRFDFSLAISPSARGWYVGSRVSGEGAVSVMVGTAGTGGTAEVDAAGSGETVLLCLRPLPFRSLLDDSAATLPFLVFRVFALVSSGS